jgi:hypothetical protein
MTTAPVALWWGEGRGASGPRYWQSADVATDDGVDIGFTVETNAVAPAGLGGECAFVNAYVTITAAAGATLTLTPIVDDTEPADTTTPNSGTLAPTPVTFTVEQQTGSAPLPLVTRTVQVPLLQSLSRSGSAVARWYPRGARCGIRLASVGAIGTGSFRIDGIELEWQPIRSVAKGTVSVP